MNTLLHLFAQPWVVRLGWTLMHFIWQGTLVAALFALVRRGAHRPQVRYVLACTAMLAMAAAPLATFVFLGSADRAPAPVSGPAALAPDSTRLAFASQPDVWSRILPWMVMLWLAGVLMFLVRLTGGWLMTTRLSTAGSNPAGAPWQQALGGLMQRMGVARPVQFLISARVDTPMVIGWLRPVLLMPLGALAGLPREHVEALLAHELAHIRRNDYIVNLMQSVAEAVLFYHPAVWWVSAQIRADREQCCDDAAIAACGDALTYARALTSFEACRPAHSQAALAANGGSLKSRIHRVLEPARPTSDILPGAGAGWALAVLAAMAIVVVASVPPAAAQEPVVDRSAIWVDTVQVADMRREVRGLGTLTSATSAQLNIAETQARDLALGQPVALAFRNQQQITHGKVARVHPQVSHGPVMVDVQVEGALPSGVQPPEPVDGVIEIERLGQVVCVGRPVSGRAESEITVFRIEPDGQSAVRTKVSLGRASIQKVEIRGGLSVGDKVIVSDMSQYAAADRVRLR